MLITTKSDRKYSLLHFCDKRMNFIEFPKRTLQRVIPLTEEIRKVMMNFNDDKELYNAISLTNLVRREIQISLQKLSIFEQIISKDEIYDLIEKCLREKQNTNAHLDEEVASDFTDHRSKKDKSSMTNLCQLEKRVNNIEEVMKSTFNMRVNAGHAINKVVPIKINSTATKQTPSDELWTPNKYDNLYYEKRQYILNLLNYKKSRDTIELNAKPPPFSTYIKPIDANLSEELHRPRALLVPDKK